MGFNLTNERIQDTYPQLLQISGSTIVDGTGSVAPIAITSASYAVTASFALNAGDIDTSSLTPLTTFNAYTSSNDSRVDSLTAATSSYLTSLPSGILSSSAQIADDISGSFTSTSASLAADIATNKSDISSLTSATSSYAVKTSDNTFSGTQTFTNIAVNGTASVAYLQSVTGSAKIIGDAYIILNNDTPAQRYAGVVVQDSGSTSNTASFEFDGQTNDWFYEYTDDGGATVDHGVTLFGPAYNTRGSHVYPTSNKLQKGTGGHHLADSSITDDGSTITFGNPVNAGNITLTGTTSKLELTGVASQIKANNITGSWGQTNGTYDLMINGEVSASTYYGDGSNLTNITSAGLVSGTGTNSLKSSDITSTPATATGDYSIAIGDGASAQKNNSTVVGRNSSTTTSATDSVVVGYGLNAQQQRSVTVGSLTTNQSSRGIFIGSFGSMSGNENVAIGYFTACSGDQAIAIGKSSNASGDSSIAIGNTIVTATNNEINIGDKFKYDGSSIMTLEATTVSSSGNFEAKGQIYSPTHAGTVASSTSSIDFDNGNFATLSLTTPTFLANPSNLKSGTTYTLIIDSGSLITNHGSAWKFAGGTSPTYTDGTDILTCVSDGTNLYATALTDFQ